MHESVELASQDYLGASPSLGTNMDCANQSLSILYYFQFGYSTAKARIGEPSPSLILRGTP